MKKPLYDEKVESGYFKKTRCSNEDGAKYLQMGKDGIELPENIIKLRVGESWDFYEVDTSPADERFADYLLYLQTKHLATIKGLVIFFGVLAVIGIAVGIVFGLYLAGESQAVGSMY